MSVESLMPPNKWLEPTRFARAAELLHLPWRAVPGNEADPARCARGCVPGGASTLGVRLISRPIRPARCVSADSGSCDVGER